MVLLMVPVPHTILKPYLFNLLGACYMKISLWQSARTIGTEEGKLHSIV